MNNPQDPQGLSDEELIDAYDIGSKASTTEHFVAGLRAVIAADRARQAQAAMELYVDPTSPNIVRMRPSSVAAHESKKVNHNGGSGASVSETVYAECRECDRCDHRGINDSSDTLAACHACDWHGPSPEEDKCPGCDRTNCMATACPRCGGRYRLIAGADLPAPSSEGVSDEPVTWIPDWAYEHMVGGNASKGPVMHWPDPKNKAGLVPLFTRPAPQEPAPKAEGPSADEIAQAIRIIDGENTMGAGLLGEALHQWLESLATSAPKAARPSTQLIEQIATQWDGCMYDVPGDSLDIGQAIREAAKRLATTNTPKDTAAQPTGTPRGGE